MNSTLRRSDAVRRLFFIFFLLACGLHYQSAWAKAFPYGVGWPRLSKLEVYIEAIDPMDRPNSRQSRFAEGIMRWQAWLGQAFTINIHFGSPPDPPPENLVHFRWRVPGTMIKGRTINQSNAITGITYDNEKKPTKIVRSDGYISSAFPAGLGMVNLGTHEFTHVMGLADDPGGSVTCSSFVVTQLTPLTDPDKQEIWSVYKPRRAMGMANEGGDDEALLDEPGVLRGRVDLLGSAGGRYDYHVTFEGEDDEIVDVMTFFIEPSLVTEVIPPPGWIYLDPVELAALGADHPYFDDYMDHSFTDPAPWESLHYITMQSTAPEYNLSTSNPQFDVTIVAPGATSGLINVFAGTEHQQVVGPVPEPSTLVLSAVLLACCGRRRQPGGPRLHQILLGPLDEKRDILVCY
jgi:hypothetical protein